MNWWILAATTATKQPGQLDMFQNLLPIFIILAVFWMFLIIPQRKQQKQRQAMLSGLKKGDRVVTIGGLQGEIVGIDDTDVQLKVAEKTELRFVRTAVARVIKK